MRFGVYNLIDLLQGACDLGGAVAFGGWTTAVDAKRGRIDGKAASLGLAFS